jgi:hypothetical protein
MLIELWERYRGYNHWVPTEATIESSQMEDHEYTYRGQTSHVYESGDTLVWIDRQGNRRTGDCEVPDDSSLYQFVGGEKVAIRYNPENPDEYYFPDLLKARLRSNFVGVVTVILFLALVMAPILVFFHVFGGRRRY